MSGKSTIGNFNLYYIIILILSVTDNRLSIGNTSQNKYLILSKSHLFNYYQVFVQVFNRSVHKVYIHHLMVTA